MHFPDRLFETSASTQMQLLPAQSHSWDWDNQRIIQLEYHWISVPWIPIGKLSEILRMNYVGNCSLSTLTGTGTRLEMVMMPIAKYAQWIYASRWANIRIWKIRQHYQIFRQITWMLYAMGELIMYLCNKRWYSRALSHLPFVVLALA